MNASSNIALETRTRLDAKTPDDDLLTAVAAGSRPALGFLYTRHADTLRATAIAALPKADATSADDIVQDVFLALLEGSTGVFQPARGKALAWLKGIVRREVAALHTPTPIPTSARKGGER